MRTPRALLAWALLLAVVLHVPAHLGFAGGEVAGRTPLFEDGPALTANPAFAPSGADGVADVALRVASDPAAAWAEGDGSVGRSRWTPVATFAFAAQRSWFGSRTAAGAAAISLLLHLVVIALSAGLFAELGLSRGASAAALALVAATPTALVAAAWPARQGVVLAAALGLLGVRAALRGGLARSIAGGALLALAGLAHPAAFAVALAVPLLRRAVADRSDHGGADVPAVALHGAAASSKTWNVRAFLRAPTIALPLAAAGAVVLRLRSLDADLLAVAPPQAQGRPPNLIDGAVGLVHHLVAFLVPTRLHVADGPWNAPFHADAVACLVLVGFLVVLHRGAPPQLRRLALAGALVLSALVLGPFLSMHPVAYAPTNEGVAYLAVPYLAAATAAAVSAAVARGGSLRFAAAAAGALLVASHVAGTLVRAAAFRTREAHVALALRETPASPVVRAWAVGRALDAFESADDAASAEAVRAIAPEAAALAADVRRADAVSLRHDPVAATTVAAILSRYSAAASGADLPFLDPALDAAVASSLAAVDLAPRWPRAWIVLGLAHECQGAVGDAFDAVGSAVILAPNDLETSVAAVRAALAAGNTVLAAEHAGEMLQLEAETARREVRPVRPELRLLFAQAAAADGMTRIPDPLGGEGTRFRFEAALAVLEGLARDGVLRNEVRRLLGQVCLLYGDALASLDRTALATIAYRRAVEVEGPAGEAAEHAAWLRRRLAEEEAKARKTFQLAARGEGNLGDALVGLATAACRRADFEEGERIFDELEQQVGLSPALRYHRAVQLLRETDPAKAVAELRAVVEAEPGLARAHFELGRLLEERGDYDGALRAYDESLRRFREGVSGAYEEWGIEAQERVEELTRLLVLQPPR